MVAFRRSWFFLDVGLVIHDEKSIIHYLFQELVDAFNAAPKEHVDFGRFGSLRLSL